MQVTSGTGKRLSAGNHDAAATSNLPTAPLSPSRQANASSTTPRASTSPCAAPADYAAARTTVSSCIVNAAEEAMYGDVEMRGTPELPAARHGKRSLCQRRRSDITPNANPNFVAPPPGATPQSIAPVQSPYSKRSRGVSNCGDDNSDEPPIAAPVLARTAGGSAAEGPCEVPRNGMLGTGGSHAPQGSTAAVSDAAHDGRHPSDPASASQEGIAGASDGTNCLLFSPEANATALMLQFIMLRACAIDWPAVLIANGTDAYDRLCICGKSLRASCRCMFAEVDFESEFAAISAVLQPLPTTTAEQEPAHGASHNAGTTDMQAANEAVSEPAQAEPDPARNTGSVQYHDEAPAAHDGSGEVPLRVRELEQQLAAKDALLSEAHARAEQLQARPRCYRRACVRCVASASRVSFVRCSC